MEVITIQSEAFQELVGKIEAINTRLTQKEKQPKEQWPTDANGNLQMITAALDIEDLLQLAR